MSENSNDMNTQNVRENFKIYISKKLIKINVSGFTGRYNFIFGNLLAVLVPENLLTFLYFLTVIFLHHISLLSKFLTFLSPLGSSNLELHENQLF